MTNFIGVGIFVVIAMASIYKRGKYFYVAYFDAQGNRRYRSTGCTNKKEANEVAVSWEKAVRKEKKSKVECQSEMADIIARAGREATVGRLTLDKARRYLMEIYRLASGEEFPSYSVSEWLTHWLDESEKRVGEATMRRYHTSVRDVLKVLGSSGEKDIALLTTEDVLRVRDFLRKSGGKASTINYKVQDFKSAIKAAFERGIIDRNVGLSVDALTTEDSDIKAGFSSEEVQQLIEAANHDWKGAILIAAQTGLRLTNIAELKWSEVDLEKRQFVLTPVKQKRGKSVVITIPMSRAVIEFFRGTEEKKSGPVFPRLSERQTSTLSTTFSNLMKKAEVPKETQLPGGKVGKRSFHSLRHYFVSALANANVAEDIRRTLSAHKSGEIHRIYTHHDDVSLRSAIELLPDLT